MEAVTPHGSVHMTLPAPWNRILEHLMETWLEDDAATEETPDGKVASTRLKASSKQLMLVWISQPYINFLSYVAAEEPPPHGSMKPPHPTRTSKRDFTKRMSSWKQWVHQYNNDAHPCVEELAASAERLESAFLSELNRAATAHGRNKRKKLKLTRRKFEVAQEGRDERSTDPTYWRREILRMELDERAGAPEKAAEYDPANDPMYWRKALAFEEVEEEVRMKDAQDPTYWRKAVMHEELAEQARQQKAEDPTYWRRELARLSRAEDGKDVESSCGDEVSTSTDWEGMSDDGVAKAVAAAALETTPNARKMARDGEPPEGKWVKRRKMNDARPLPLQPKAASASPAEGVEDVLGAQSDAYLHQLLSQLQLG
eukprot:TRINITY_DN3199_c0_g1_i1.p1 TRINITY_DN3199_c0_g1~~TRINITY_DN3199_c0_g1_i1.p1  ORF type:complete len:387 (+),score=104.39 TRINITY_DN3199_c0_g1_i1:49-1161(+)